VGAFAAVRFMFIFGSSYSIFPLSLNMSGIRASGVLTLDQVAAGDSKAGILDAPLELHLRGLTSSRKHAGYAHRADHKRRHVERLERSKFSSKLCNLIQDIVSSIEPAIQTNAFITLRCDTLLTLSVFIQLRLYLQHVRKPDKHQQCW
jgi:hypothetical protein